MANLTEKIVGLSRSFCSISVFDVIATGKREPILAVTDLVWFALLQSIHRLGPMAGLCASRQNRRGAASVNLGSDPPFAAMITKVRKGPFAPTE